ncbi:hypothetical protein [Oligoflexus tunisiensis]|uniref:hypothetical protein n=1 Tax=Oligoflexus tunisiensis TaxID=708132 RepID=UPI00114CC4F8|nr:hypothetical protein [Oligoflexus tunisiensis]
MNKAQGFAALGLLLLLSCKGATFKNQIDEKQDSTTAQADNDDDQVIALEPSSIGGAFLGCFVDSQIQPELLEDLPTEGEAIGCQAFGDSNFTQVLGRGSLVADQGTILVGDSEQSLAFQPVDAHSRWAWVTRIPTEARMDSLNLKVRAEEGDEPVNLRVELLDSMPAVLAADPEALKSSTYKLRLKGTDQCLDGNPVWRLNVITQKPVADALQIAVCSEALDFRFRPYEDGYRLFVANPKPAFCDIWNYVVDLCKHSCLDLEDYGQGQRFILWACTYSKAAQSYVMIPDERGAVRLQVNSRFVSLRDGLIQPDPEDGIAFELVPSLVP